MQQTTPVPCACKCGSQGGLYRVLFTSEVMLKAISPWRSFWVGSLLLALISLPAFAQHYTRTDLTSNISGAAPNFDPHLVNGWGLTRGTPTPWWVSDAGAGV